jgi:type II secretory pathway pseudopilin PulG
MTRPHPERRRRADRGATLVEAAIVLMIIAAASLFAVPWFQSSQIRANESEARRQLRELAAAEERFLDQNGGRTYGLLHELLGEASRRDVVVEPPALAAPGLKRLDLMAQKKGYLFCLYLPSEAGSTPYRRRLDTERAGAAFVAYAWPVNAGYSGRLVYVVDESGVVRQWANERGRELQGFDHPPSDNFAPHPKKAFGDPPPNMRSATWEPAPGD